MTDPLRRRLDAIANKLPKNLEELEQRAAEAAIARRIDRWTADIGDFAVIMAPDIEEARTELIEKAVDHRRRRWAFGPNPVGEWRPDFLAAAVVDHAPGEPEHEEALATLERIAEPCAHDVERRNPWKSFWFEANRYLVVLGDDRGASLHAAAAPAMAAARTVWLEGREELAACIRDGSAHKLDFLGWVSPDLEERRQQLLLQAQERRAARHAGAPLAVDDVSDAAAEVGSYLLGEAVPEEHTWYLQAAREQQPVPGTPGHEEWIEANELHWVLGPWSGCALRELLGAMIEKNVPAPS